jgi:acetyl esterase/lipase
MRVRSLVVVAMLALVAAGCALIAPGGAGPLRYRDEIFPNVTVTSDVVYGSAVDQTGATDTLKLDVYQPTGDTVTARPAMVWVHGGSFVTGDKTSPELVDEANTLSRKGYVNVSINYRLSPTGCSSSNVTQACIQGIIDAKHDAQAAVRFLRANAATYHVDPNRISVGGSSAGAITALNVGFETSDFGSSGNPGFSSSVSAAISLSGAALTVNPHAGGAASLLFHGTADPLVPYQWAVSTQQTAAKAGLPSELITFDGAGHVPYVQHRQEILDDTTNFLYWAMRLMDAAQ